MNTWGIKVLYYGHLVFPKSAVTPNLDTELVLDYPYLGFLLQKDGHNVLVDTGISEKYIIDGKAWGGFPAVGGRQYLEKALADANANPDDIEIVIYTHLHNDHAANCSLFKNARFITQKDEWRILLDPLPIMKVRRDYDPNLVEELRQVNLLLVDGDLELTDGIKLYKTPGHTPGGQSIAVTTRKGVVVLIGDLCPLACLAFPKQTELVDMHGKRHKITPPPDVYGSVFPVSVVYNYFDFYDSVSRIRAIASADTPEFIIGGHEASLLFTGI